MIANEGLTETKLNSELAKQVSAYAACLLLAAAALRMSGRLTMLCTQQDLPAARVLTPPAAPAAPAPPAPPPAFSAARRAGPAMSAVIIAALLLVCVECSMPMQMRRCCFVGCV
jgi:hypothetical protein